VTARRRRRVLDRQRQQLLARRADLDTRVHLGASGHPHSRPGPGQSLVRATGTGQYPLARGAARNPW
jgi:hypothetical protein